MLLPTTVGGKHHVFGLSARPYVRCLLTRISLDTRPLSVLVEGFEWNLEQIFITWVGTAWKVFKVRDQRVIV